MFQKIHRFAIVAGGVLLVMVGLGTCGGMLEAFGIVTSASIGSTGRTILIIFYLFLFLVLAFALAPLFIRAFTALQTSIGHGDMGPVKVIKDNERRITYVVWGIFGLGFLIALPRAISDWFMTGR